MPAPLHCRNCGAKAKHDTLAACMVYWRLKCRDAMRKNTAHEKRVKELEAKLRGKLERDSDRFHAVLSAVEENTRSSTRLQNASKLETLRNERNGIFRGCQK